MHTIQSILQAKELLERGRIDSAAPPAFWRTRLLVAAFRQSAGWSANRQTMWCAPYFRRFRGVTGSVAVAGVGWLFSRAFHLIDLEGTGNATATSFDYVAGTVHGNDC